MHRRQRVRSGAATRTYILLVIALGFTLAAIALALFGPSRAAKLEPARSAEACPPGGNTPTPYYTNGPKGILWIHY